MSSKFTQKLVYRCVDDCTQQGCPGHIMQLQNYRTVNMIIVLVDGNMRVTFDSNQWDTLMKLSKELEDK